VQKLLINDCLQDFKNGVLHQKNFKPKSLKPKSTETSAKTAKEMGLTVG
jgi:hypothetical protein